MQTNLVFCPTTGYLVVALLYFILCFKAQSTQAISVRPINLPNYYRSIAYSMDQLSEQSIYKHFTGYLPSRTSCSLEICSPSLRHALVMSFLYLRWFSQAENILCPPLDIHQVASAINEIVRWAYYIYSSVCVWLCVGVGVYKGMRVCLTCLLLSCCHNSFAPIRQHVHHSTPSPPASCCG